MAEAELIMERPLAMRLLHEAQIAQGEVRGVVAASAAVDRYYPGEWTTVSEKAVEEGRKPWAVFAFKPGSFEAPGEADFALQRDLLRITASLEIQGVLQLRVYRCGAAGVEECPLKIVD